MIRSVHCCAETQGFLVPKIELMKYCKMVLSFCSLFTQSLKIPPRFQEAIDLGSVTIRSKPFHDSEVSSQIVSSTGNSVSKNTVVKERQ